MTIQAINNYLEEKITNNWYKNVAIDYGIIGRFIKVEIKDDEHLKIIWEEQDKTRSTTIAYFKDYRLEELYNIWMECEEHTQCQNTYKTN